MFAAALARNQVPIKRDENLNGANLDTIDNPIGQKKSHRLYVTGKVRSTTTC